MARLPWRRGARERDSFGRLPWSRDEPSQREVTRLLRESEGFLEGSLALEHAEKGESVLDWEWVNLLAHANERQLERLAQRRLLPRTSPGYDLWHAALAFLAEEVLEAARRAKVDVESLQRSVLVPLELEIVADGPLRCGGPAPTVRCVLERLRPNSVSDGSHGRRHRAGGPQGA